MRPRMLYARSNVQGFRLRSSVARTVGKSLARRYPAKSNNGPSGSGLAKLQKFAPLNKSRIQIASRFAFNELNRDDDEIFTAMAVGLPGTAVAIQANPADQAWHVLESELQSDGASGA